MNRVKTHIRSLLSDERTSDLTLLAFEKKILKNLDVNIIIDKFVQKKSRRIFLEVSIYCFYQF